MEVVKQKFFIIILIMNDIKFRNLNLSLIVPFVLFQKKYTDELNGNIFSKKETIRNLKNKYYYTYICLQKDTIVGFLSAQKILDTFEIHSYLYLQICDEKA